MSITVRPVIGVATPLPEEQAAPAVSCDQCAYFHPLFEDAMQGRCIHTWSDHAGDLVFSIQSCPHLTSEYDPSLDATSEAAWSYRR